MTRPDLLLSLVQASAELQRAESAAYVAGRHDLVAEIRAQGFRIAKLIAQAGRQQHTITETAP